MARLGKRERQLRREQWKLYRKVRAEAISENMQSLEADTSRGYAKDTIQRVQAKNSGAYYRGGFDRAERGSYPFHPGGH